MTAILKNFVALVKSREDLLNNAEYRSIVEMILGLLDKGHHKELALNYKRLQDHLEDYDNPHYNPKDTFFDEIVTKVYGIYQNMLAAPLGFDDFKEQIVPTSGFIELIRRIVLNRYLYLKVKSSIGSVPNSVAIPLSGDWGQDDLHYAPITIAFGPGINNETDFIRLGWQGNTSPIATIFTAEDLGPPESLPTLFETSSAAPSRIEENQPVYMFPIRAVSNDLTARLHIVGATSVKKTVLTMSNGKDTFAVIVYPDQTIEVTQNDVSLIKTPTPVYNGKVIVSISKYGTILLKAWQPGRMVSLSADFLFEHDVPLTVGVIRIKTEDPAVPVFSLRHLEICAGYISTPASPTIIIPDGFAVLTDPDGTWLYDPDGSPLIDYDVTVPEGYALVTDDEDGSYLIDDDNSFIVDPVTKPTTQYN